LAHLFIFKLLRNWGQKKASAYIFTVPLSAMGFAMLFLNEPLIITTFIGGTFGIAAVYLINK